MPVFVLVQLIGAAAAVGVVALLYPDVTDVADAAVVPHDGSDRPESPVPEEHP